VEGSPWGDLYGKALDANGLRRRVKKYLPPGELSKSQKIRIGADVRNGYTREQLIDAWVRYLPPLPENPEHREHPEHLDVEDPPSLYADEWATG
jgi:hypothetical protein